jgi:uncharacterized protein (DUF3084 family)
MKYANILAATKSEAIFPVVNGLAVEADGYMLTHEQMENVETALHEAQAIGALHTMAQEQLAAAQQELTQIQANLTTADEARQAAEAALATANSDLQAERDANTIAAADLATAQQQLTAAQEQIANLQAENATLKEDTPIGADTNKQKDSFTKGVKKTRNSIDAYVDRFQG